METISKIWIKPIYIIFTDSFFSNPVSNSLRSARFKSISVGDINNYVGLQYAERPLASINGGLHHYYTETNIRFN